MRQSRINVETVAYLEQPGSFRFSSSVTPAMSCGDYVLLSSSTHIFLGQVEKTTLDFIHLRQDVNLFPKHTRESAFFNRTKIIPKGLYEGEGRVLAEIQEKKVILRFDRKNCSGEFAIQPALPKIINSYFVASYADISPLLPIGTMLNVQEPLRVNLIPDGLKRPTGLFGQSGSGKSFALAIILEELHFNTGNDVKIVILDPNGDFVHFKKPLRKLKEIKHKSNKYIFKKKEIDTYRKQHSVKQDSVKIFSIDPTIEAGQIVVRFCDLNLLEQALLLGLDPSKNRDEYYALSQIVAELSMTEYELQDVASKCLSKGYDNLFPMIENLQRERLSILRDYDDGREPLMNMLNYDKFKTAIIDLSSLSRREKTVVSTVVFRTIWDSQLRRKQNRVEKPTFLVVDEAHNLFPVKQLFIEQTTTLEWGRTIAGEGRKYGLYLLISSQLPSKIHEHVLTQCGNVIMMKMLSQSDIDTLQDSFSFVSEKLLWTSKYFATGEAIVIGGIVPAPCLIHFEGRKTQEGGADFNVKWS